MAIKMMSQGHHLIVLMRAPGGLDRCWGVNWSPMIQVTGASAARELVGVIQRGNVVAQGVKNGLGAIAQVELVEDVGNVAADGGQTDE
jgi:hypothetical protein